MKVLFASLAVLAVLPLFAIDAVWNKPAATAQNWRTAGNWKDAATGQTASAAPQYAGDTAAFPDPTASGFEQQTVETGPSDYSGPWGDQGGVDPVLDAVSGDYHTVISHIRPYMADARAVRRYFTVTDPNAFTGWWTTGVPWGIFVIGSVSGDVPTLSSLSLCNKPVVSVADADATARVGTIYHGGPLVKEGEGTLRVGTTTGTDTEIKISAGTVSLEGRAAAAKALLARAATGSVVAGAREVFAAADWTSGAPFTLSDDTARGESTLDGQPVGASACKAAALTGYHLVQVALPAGVTVTRSSVADGEVVVFAEALTREERQLVTDVLRARWVGGTELCDAGRVQVDAAAASVGVVAGACASVSQVKLAASDATALRKTDDGLLEVGYIYPSSKGVAVEAGGVGVPARDPTGDFLKPADGAWIWLDANRTDKMTVSVESGTAYVSEWRDCRDDVDLAAVWDSELSSGRPYWTTSSLSPTGQTGTNMLLFIKGNAALKLPNWQTGTAAARSVFFAARDDGYPGTPPAIGASTGSQFTRGNYTFATASSTVSLLGQWSINGTPVDPLADNEFYSSPFSQRVVSFTSNEPFLTDSILRTSASSAASGNNCGGLYLCEYIVYNRELTPAEKRATEIYLMRKWCQVKVHPEAGPTCLASASFADAKPVVLSATGTGSVARVTGGDGTLVKKGVGKLHVADVSAADISSFSVEAGDLVVGLGPDDSLFHFDASDAESVDTRLEDLGGGSVRTNVYRWSDVRRNGAFAHYQYRTGLGTYVENDRVEVPPTYHLDETTSGQSRPVVDFGIWLPGDISSGMKLDRDYSNVRDAIVFGRNSAREGVNGCAPMFGANGNWYSQYATFKTGSCWEFFGDNCGDEIKKGYVGRNGEQVAYNSTYLLSQYGYYEVAPTNNVLINALAIYMYYNAETSYAVGNAGGWRICEELAFDHTLSVEERAYWCAKIRYKWQGVGTKPVWTNETPIASISVAKGATFTDREAVHLTVASLSGGGTVNCGELAGVSSLTLDGASALTVNGKLILADAGTVTVDSSSAAKGVKFPLLAATELEAASLSKWTATGTGGAKVKLSVEGNTLYGLVRGRSGVVLFIR